MDEWRFHAGFQSDTSDDGLPFDLPGFRAKVLRAVAWCKSRTTPMVLGSFGCPKIDAGTEIRPYMREAMSFVQSEAQIVDAVWWNLYHEGEATNRHLATKLANGQGFNLNADGVAYEVQSYLFGSPASIPPP